MVFEEAVVTHGIEAKCASPRLRPNPEIDWHRDRYPRDMINPAGRNYANRQPSPSSNAIIDKLIFNAWVNHTKCIGPPFWIVCHRRWP